MKKSKLLFLFLPLILIFLIFGIYQKIEVGKVKSMLNELSYKVKTDKNYMNKNILMQINDKTSLFLIIFDNSNNLIITNSQTFKDFNNLNSINSVKSLCNINHLEESMFYDICNRNIKSNKNLVLAISLIINMKDFKGYYSIEDLNLIKETIYSFNSENESDLIKGYHAYLKKEIKEKINY